MDSGVYAAPPGARSSPVRVRPFEAKIAVRFTALRARAPEPEIGVVGRRTWRSRGFGASGWKEEPPITIAIVKETQRHSRKVGRTEREGSNEDGG